MPLGITIVLVLCWCYYYVPLGKLGRNEGVVKNNSPLFLDIFNFTAQYYSVNWAEMMAQLGKTDDVIGFAAMR